MHRKTPKGAGTAPLPSVRPQSAPALPSFGAAPAKGLSAAFDAALGGRGAGGHIGQAADAARSGRGRPPDLIDKARKPAPGANRTVAPGKGHR